MKTAAIICEYNPFHAGHARLFEFARANGADRIACVMSGNFTQRGEPAVADKYVRAAAALRAGADLVVELPMPYSVSGAEFFATAGVYIADRMGANELYFGSENGDISALSKVARNMLDTRFAAASHDKSGGYAKSASEIYESLFGKNEVASSPNNILALEYIKAIMRLGSTVMPVTLAREDNFSSEDANCDFPSAAALRKLITSGDFPAAAKYMGEKAALEYEKAARDDRFPIRTEKYYDYLHFFFRAADPKVLSAFHGADGGLAEYIVSRANEAPDTAAFLSSLPTKKYTNARIRRTLVSAFLGVTNADVRRFPAYSLLLAANRAGREVLARLRGREDFYVATKEADIRDDAFSAREREISDKADALYTLLMPEKRGSAFFKKMPPTIVD